MARGIPVLCLATLLCVHASVALSADDPEWNGKPLTAWINEVKSSNVGVRLDALEAIGNLGTKAKQARAVVLDSLGDTDSNVRSVAAEIIKGVYKSDPEIVGLLVGLLGSKDELKRVGASTALCELGVAAKAALPSLLERMNDQNETSSVRLAAALAAKEMKPEDDVFTPMLLSLLNSADKHVRLQTVEVIGTLGEVAQKSAPRVIELLGDSDPEVKMSAMQSLGRISPDPHAAVPVLIAALQGIDGSMFAARGLGLMGTAARDAIPALISALEYQDDNTRAEAAVALGRIGVQTKDVLPALVRTLSDKSYEVRRSAVCALGELGPAAAPAVPALNKMSTREQASTVQYAIGQALPKIGPAAQAVIESERAATAEPAWQGRSLKQWTDLFRANENSSTIHPPDALTHFGEQGYEILGDAVEGDDEKLRDAARGVLSQPGPHAKLAATQLVRGLKCKDVVARRFTASAIGKLGRDGEDAVGMLVLALSDDDIPVRFHAADALGEIGPPARDAVHALIRCLRHEDRDLRRSALDALGGIGPGAKDAEPILIEMFRKPGNDDRCFIPLVLGKIGTADPLVMPTIIRALRDGDYNTRRFAAMGIAEMGAQASDAIPALVEIARNKREIPDVRTSAADALGKIGKAAAEAALPALSDAVKTEKDNGEFRAHSIKALAILDPQAAIILPTLESVLDDPTIVVQMQAIETLGNLGASAKHATSVLGDIVSNPQKYQEPAVRMVAVEAIAKIGPTKEGTDALNAALSDPDTTVQRLAKEALQKVRSGQ